MQIWDANRCIYSDLIHLLFVGQDGRTCGSANLEGAKITYFNPPQKFEMAARWPSSDSLMRSVFLKLNESTNEWYVIAGKVLKSTPFYLNATAVDLVFKDISNRWSYVVLRINQTSTADDGRYKLDLSVRNTEIEDFTFFFELRLNGMHCS